LECYFTQSVTLLGVKLTGKWKVKKRVKREGRDFLLIIGDYLSVKTIKTYS